MMTTSFWAYSCISVSQAFKSTKTERYLRLHFLFPTELCIITILQSIMVRLSHSYPWTLLWLFITETGNSVAKQTITSCHFQRELWENAGGSRSTLHVNRQSEAFSLKGFRKRKWRESRERMKVGGRERERVSKWEGKVIWDDLTLILSNDGLLVISYNRSNAVKEKQKSSLVASILFSAHGLM